MNPRTVAYIRVSTEGQAADGVSLEMQMNKVRAYCELNDLDLMEVVEDAGISAKSIKKRPGFLRILEMVKARTIDAVIVYKLDRAFRNTIEALEISQMMDSHNVALHSITEKLDTKSAIGRFFFTLIASLAEMERNIIAERTAAAMQQKKSNGEQCGFQAPYGYRHEDGKVVPDEKESACLFALQTMRLNRPKWSYRKLARELAKQGCVSRQWVTKKGEIRGGVEFQPKQIKSMLGE